MLRLDLENHVALVGGSTRGIGWAIAQELARQGAQVVLLGRNAERLESCRKQLRRLGAHDHRVLLGDHSHPEALREKVEAEVVAQGLPVSIMINNTGGPPPGAIAEASSEDFQHAFRQHLVSHQLLVQACLPLMQERRYGRIVNIVSTSVKQPIPHLGVSNTVRGAVANWAKTLASEVGPYGITVNNILPGYTQTDRLNGIIQNQSRQSGRNEETVAAAMQADIPAGRFGRPEEPAYAVLFLASPYAAYINGVNLPVDGGRTSAL
jgi:3-oxoacyl-[acyl-carrier protein] reductase